MRPGEKLTSEYDLRATEREIDQKTRLRAAVLGMVQSLHGLDMNQCEYTDGVMVVHYLMDSLATFGLTTAKISPLTSPVYEKFEDGGNVFESRIAAIVCSDPLDKEELDHETDDVQTGVIFAPILTLEGRDSMIGLENVKYAVGFMANSELVSYRLAKMSERSPDEDDIAEADRSFVVRDDLVFEPVALDEAEMWALIVEFERAIEHFRLMQQEPEIAATIPLLPGIREMKAELEITSDEPISFVGRLATRAKALKPGYRE